MLIFGLSVIDTLLCLLLIELTWWGYVFVIQFIPQLISYVILYCTQKSSFENEHDHFRQKRVTSDYIINDLSTVFDNLTDFSVFTEDIVNLVSTFDMNSCIIYGFLLFLRFKAPLLLLVTILRNQENGYKGWLKFWYWSSLILDLVIFLFLSMFPFVSGKALIPTILDLILINFPFFFLRILFWNISSTVVKQIQSKENASKEQRYLLPASSEDDTVQCNWKAVFGYINSKHETLPKILISWEIMFGIVVLISSIFYLIYHGLETFYSPIWKYPFPNWYMFIGWTGLVESGWDLICTFIGLIWNILSLIITSALYFGITRSRTTLCKFFCWMYVIFEVGCFLLVQIIQIYSTFQMLSYPSEEIHVLIYITLVIDGIMDCGTIFLKIILVAYTLKWACFVSAKRKNGALRPLLKRNDAIRKANDEMKCEETVIGDDSEE